MSKTSKEIKGFCWGWELPDPRLCPVSGLVGSVGGRGRPRDRCRVAQVARSHACRHWWEQMQVGWNYWGTGVSYTIQLVSQGRGLAQMTPLKLNRVMLKLQQPQSHF